MTMKFARRTGLIVVVVGACGAQPTVVPTRNLERPSDMAFVCVGAAGDGLVSGRPMSVCHPASAKDPVVDNFADRPVGTFSLVTNTARGELAVIDMDAGRLLDLDPQLPGFNMVPVGLLPESLAVSQDGCRVVSTNRGSCDLTLVDPGRLLAPQIRGHSPSSGAGSATLTVVPRTRSGRLQVAPQEVVFLKQDMPADVAATGLCRSDAASEGADGQTLRPWRALVTFPACDLVALVELPSGQITSSVYIRETGAVDAGDDPVCPVECGVAPVTPPAADAGATLPGVAAKRVLHAGALALVPDGTRVYVGAADAPFVTVLDVSADKGIAARRDGGKIPLHEGAIGTTRLRLSVDPFGSDRELGKFLGGHGAFLYAFAKDASIRVLALPANPDEGPESECDLNIEPGGPSHDDDATKACVPWTGDADARRHRAFTTGPGLRLESDVDRPAPVPRDISFASLVPLPTETASGDFLVSGVFGYLLASNGQVYLLNLHAPLRNGEDKLPYPHSLRNGNISVNETQGRGHPRVDPDPSENFTFDTVAFPTHATFPSKTFGPRIENTAPVAASTSASTGKFIAFPNAAVVTPQRWTIAWEDILSGSDRQASRLETTIAGVQGAGSLLDAGADFCKTGVMTGDIVNFVGCLRDLDCGPLGSATCVLDVPAAPGLCVPRASAKDETYLRACGRYLNSRRRYEIVSAGKTTLTLGLKLDEVPKPSIKPCVTDDECQPDVEHKAVSLRHSQGFRCLQVKADEPKRCVQPCAEAVDPARPGVVGPSDRACRAGHVCEDVGALPGVGPLCVEGPPIPTACFVESPRYHIQAGRTFVVKGGSIPRIQSVREVGGLCVPDTSRPLTMVDRIPVGPFPASWGRTPHCSGLGDWDGNACTGGLPCAAADAIGRAPAADTGWGNPCAFIGPNADEGTAGSSTPQAKALFQNSQLRFVMTNLDQYWGDSALISFEVQGGFVPDIVVPSSDALVTLGARIVTGPMETPESPGGAQTATSAYVSFPYIYVLDQGRSSSGSRGQVLRLNPRTGTTGSGRFDSLYTQSTYPIQ